MFVKNDIISEVIELLKSLIKTPSFSKKETQTAALIQRFFKKKNIPFFTKENNIWAKSKYWNSDKPTLLLNSHHDTVKPVASWTLNPFEAKLEHDKIYGLGSNDAGGSLVALLATFIHFFDNATLPYNLIFAATAEEEISGKNGIVSILPALEKIDLAIVGEPTQMQIAIAEKGLMVIDARAIGKAGHAAREEGDNAILKAMKDIQWIQNFKFPRTSKWLGNIKCSVTQINAGTQHNVVPDQCNFVMDIRTTDQYTNEEVFKIIQDNMQSELKARSFRLQASGISENHPIIKTGKLLNLDCFGSPTLSDQALLPFPSIKIGPGDSSRSHTADEFIKISEITQGIETYISIIRTLPLT